MRHLPEVLLTSIFANNSCKDQKNIAAVNKHFYKLMSNPSLTLFQLNSPITTFKINTVSIVLTRIRERFDHNTHRLTVFDEGKKISKLDMFLDKEYLEIILRHMKQGPETLLQKLHKETGCLKRLANYLSGNKDEPKPLRPKKRV
ncbi:MAG: hypothetical protein H0U75_08740 [Legionella sp.]|nr:hypothetical protein [Legionella sp.]